MSNRQNSKNVEDLLARIVGSKKGVIVDFKGSHCAPCKQLEPILKELAEEFHETLDVLIVDIEEHAALAQRYGVRSVPTLLGFFEGRVRAQQVGFSHPRRVREMFAELALL